MPPTRYTPSFPSAILITIGDELLLGQVVDTNSAWLGQRLAQAGIAVRQRWAVGDVREEIADALTRAEQSDSALVILTGGLGPTDDDLTKPVLCEHFGMPLRRDSEVLAQITHLLEQVMKRPMIERNRQQADVPDRATVLHNAVGTAPGLLFRRHGKIFVALPGVPSEMRWLIEQHLLPLLEKETTFSAIPLLHRTLVCTGIGESFLAEHLRNFEAQLPATFKLAYLPHFGVIRLRLTARDSASDFPVEFARQFAALVRAAAPYPIWEGDASLPEIVAHLLRARGQTLALAEACTGGHLAQLCHEQATCCDWFLGGMVCCSRALQESLGVNAMQVAQENTLNDKVRATSIALAEGARRQLCADYALATCGVMGPEPLQDTRGETLPPGTLWLAIAGPCGTVTRHQQWRSDRSGNIQRAALAGLLFLREQIAA